MTGPSSRTIESVPGGTSGVAPVSLLAGDLSDLRDCLIELKDQTQASCIFLVNLDGQIILSTNDPAKFDPYVVGVLVSSGMATAVALTDAMEEDEVSTLHFYESSTSSICAALLRPDMLVCLLFEEKDETLRLGNVWHYLKRGIDVIRPLLPSDTDCPKARPVYLATQENGERRRPTDRLGNGSLPKVQIAEASSTMTSSRQELLSFDEAVELGIVTDRSQKSANSNNHSMAK